jgi:hypothetical protein
MSWSVRPTEAGKWEMILQDEPTNIYALNTSSALTDPLIQSGVWLVVAFPVWSGPIRRSVIEACECARRNPSLMNLGVMPFGEYTEITEWWPECFVAPSPEISSSVDDCGTSVRISMDATQDPRWTVLCNGRAVYVGFGPRTKEELLEIVQDAIAGQRTTRLLSDGDCI